MQLGISTAKRLIWTGALVGALALPAAAVGKTNTLTGSFAPEGVPGNGTVKVKVKANRRNKPKKLKSIIYENLSARCNMGDFENPAYVPAGTLSGDAGPDQGSGLEFDRSFFWVSYPDNGARQVLANGKLNRRGTRVQDGRLEVHNNVAGCQSAVGTFTAKK